jgi:hypothetical protein
MAGLFDSLFGFEDLEAKTQNLLKTKYNAARAGVEGSFAGAGREGEANLAIQAQRQGLIGSPIESALRSRLGTALAGEKGKALAGINTAEASDTASTMGNLGMQKAQANAALMSSIFSGIGGLTGTLAGKFTTPAIKP